MGFLCWNLLNASAQNRQLSLQDFIYMAQSQSSSFKVAQTQKEVSHYQFLTYQSDYKPQISLSGTAPSYNKQFLPITQADGSVLYLPVQQNQNNIGLSLSQVLPFSGGTVSLNTGFSEFYDFRSKFNQYNGTPVFIQLTQGLFGFNDMKWKKRIEPLKLQEANRSYVQNIESIAQKASQLFFDALDAQTNIHIARANLVNDSVNYAIEKKRVDLGTTTEDKLLQLELGSLRSRQALEKASYDYKTTVQALKTYIGYKDSTDFELRPPEDIPALSVSLGKAIECTRLYRPEYITFERKKKEAERDVAQARAAKKEIDLSASYGFNRAATSISPIYTDPVNQQTFSISINIPIIDWGRQRARYNTALAEEKLVDFDNDIDSTNITQEVTTLVNNIELLTDNIILSRVTDSVAERRFDIANRLFQLGKLSIVEINVAGSERDQARRAYISALRDYWNAYYLLRRLTMYDFTEQRAL